MTLWHADIRLPVGFALPTGRVDLSWTRHADGARKDDRYGQIPRFESLPLQAFQVIEVETRAVTGTTKIQVQKVVVRGHWTDRLDVVFVLIPGPVWVVKTVWINERNDVHATLDRSRYAC